MKRLSILFLQAAIVLICIAALAVLIRLPLTEGRAANLNLASIYADPFILYGYAASTAFFIALYKAFRLLGYIGRNEAFSSKSVSALRSIRYCAIALSVLIVVAGLYISLFHNKKDDPAGFLAICMMTAFISMVVATAATVFENILHDGIQMKTDRDDRKAKNDLAV